LHIGEQLYKLFQEYIRVLDSNKLRPSIKVERNERNLIKLMKKIEFMRARFHRSQPEKEEKLEKN
jgi:hypothetical protein